MKSHYKKRKTRYEVEVSPNGRVTAHGGLLLVDSLARDLGLWKMVAGEPSLDRRTRKGAGYDPLSIVSQLVFTLCDGGASLADAERVGQDPVLMESVGLERAADQSTVGEWLRGATEDGIRAMRAVNSRLAREILSRCAPRRILHAGALEVWFDDTEIEVCGRKFEGARVNYNGDLALSWQTLWAGPLILDQEFGGFRGVAECQRAFLDGHGGVWRGGKSHFYADSGSSAAPDLAHLSRAGFGTWSVSRNKWETALDRLAGELPEEAWDEPAERGGVVESYAWLRHSPGGLGEPRLFAARRWKAPGEMFWRYSYTACEDDSGRTPRAVCERHRLKGDFGRRFSEVLSDLDLHHPPCLALNANRMFYAVASLAHNLLQALRLLRLADDQQQWRNRTVIRNVILVPATQIAHANRRRLRVWAPPGLLRWWRLFLHDLVPRRRRGERPDEDPPDEGPPGGAGA